MLHTEDQVHILGSHYEYKRELQSIHTLILYILFLFCFLILSFRGLSLHPDSNGYIDHSLTREPGYPLVITFGKILFSNNYQVFLIIIQVLIACVSAFYFCKTSADVLKIDGLLLCILYIIIAIYYDFTSLFFPHWGQSMILTILAEAIAYPLFLIYVALAIRTLFNRSYKHWILATLVCTLLFFVRHSSSYLFIVQLLSAIYLFHKTWKKIIVSISIILLSVVIATLGELLYFKILIGSYTTRTFVPVNTMLNFLLLADETDINNYQDELTREIFTKTYEEMNSQGYIMSEDRLSQSPIERAKYISAAHDYVMFDIYQPIINEYFDEQGISSALERAKIEDQISKEIYKPLVLKHFSQWIKGYIGIVISSFHASACAIDPPLRIMNVFSLSLYIVILVLLWIKRHNKDAVLLFSLVFLLVCGCIFSTSLFMHCLPRLVIYNFPIIYLLAIYLLHAPKRSLS